MSLFRTSLLGRKVLRLAQREFSTVSKRSNILRASSDAAEKVVKVSWGDGHVSEFAPVWLVDHDPAFVHPTSLQRQLDPLLLDASISVPDVVQVLDEGKSLKLKWQGKKEIVFPSEWLREHCYDDESRAKRQADLRTMRTLWKSADMPKDKFPTVSSSAVLQDDSVLLRALESLVQYGAVIVTDMPLSVEGTEKVVRRFGPPRETFYGVMNDTAPKDAVEVNDTAYTKDALDAHTDTCYFVDSAGLQVFNCVAQSESETGFNADGELEGATKLVDGFKLVDDLKRLHPETYKFFSETALKWRSIEKGVHVMAWARVITMDESGDCIKQFRFNEYDLAPLDYLAPAEVEAYYRHLQLMCKMIRNPEYISYVRLNVGEMVIVDNHRVCHGRTAFTGFRNMVGCYVGEDDWKSKVRSLRQGKLLINDA